MSASPMPGSWHHPLLPSWLWQWAVVRQATRMAIRINLCNALRRMHDDPLRGSGGHRAGVWLRFGIGWRRPDHGTNFVGSEGRGCDARGCRGASCPVGRPIACPLDFIEIRLTDAWEQVGVWLRDVSPSLPLAGGMHGLHSDLVDCCCCGGWLLLQLLLLLLGLLLHEGLLLQEAVLLLEVGSCLPIRLLLVLLLTDLLLLSGCSCLVELLELMLEMLLLGGCNGGD